MTEKRFYCKKDGINQWSIADRLNQYPMPITSLEFCSVVANALNGLWHQTQRFEKHNQRLLEENDVLKQSLSQTSRELQYGVKKVQKLAKENEQLKKQIERIDFILDDLNGAEYISRDDGIKALNKIDKVIGKR